MTKRGHFPGNNIYRGFRIIREDSVLIVSDSISFSDVESAIRKVLKCINGKCSNRRIEFPDDETIESVVNNSMGLSTLYGPVPEVKGQTSRLAIAWWTDDNLIKHLRVFGDRIHCTEPHAEVPRLYSFGHESYYVIYPTNHPHHCLHCKCQLKKGDGTWHKNEKDIDPLEIEPIIAYFLCNGCQYEHETGFRQGNLKKKS